MTIVLLAVARLAFRLFVCLVAADFIAGFLHWFEDTWLAPGIHPLIDRWIVAPNIEHHEKPGGIRECSYWVLNCVCIAMAVAGAIAAFAAGLHQWEIYATLFVLSQSNQIHAWGHTANPPAPIAWLQRIGVLQSAKMHAAHHRRPYGVRYCTTTNLVNPVLDATKFWRGLEWIGERCGARVVRATSARAGF